MEPKITTGQIFLHNKKFSVLQTNPLLPLPQPQQPTNQTPALLRRTTALIPDHDLLIPCPPHLTHLPSVAVQPASDDDLASLPPQICPISNANIIYTNPSSSILLSKNKTPLLCLPITTIPNPLSHLDAHLQAATPCPERPPPRPPESIHIPLPTNLPPQLTSILADSHSRNNSAFQQDLSVGYNHHSGTYFANLRFKENSRPEAKSLDVPQYNRQCSALQQALMDRLEHQQVLVNPHHHGIEVKSVSPSWVIQKGSAKSKPLKDCTLDELRWVVAFNNLNEHLLPKPAKISSANKAIKFLARWRYHILADLHNSYFQIHVAKKHWCWLGVMTPHKGLRVLTRLGQGLLNSEGELDELLAIVLGDLITEGICEIARDDIQVGGNTHIEAITNWNRVLTRLADNNLKVSPRKVRIFPESTEVYGVKLQHGKISPSDHVLSSLGITAISQLKTVRQVNAWRGLYKTLLQYLPNLAAFMNPFDLATANKNSRDQFSWTPELTAAFNEAQAHLKNSHTLALPAPNEQLILQPDGAQKPPCIGWVLSVSRLVDQQQRLLPVQYCSAKLKPHMRHWSPCEIEAVATFIAVEQCAPWIMEAHQPTYVCPDSKAVVQAAARMQRGKMSTNPRLQNLLACINRRPIIFQHSSAKLGQHLISDTCSRTARDCTVSDCAIERFLADIPDKIELMAVAASLAALISDPAEPALIAATAPDLISKLSYPSSTMPMGSPATWHAIQASDPDSAVVLHCKRTGDSPRKKNTNPAINRMFSGSVLKDGVLVVPSFDHKTMRTINRVVVPPSYLPTLLTIIHVKCNHPSKYQTEQIFQRYFFAPPGLEAKIATLYDQCYTCQATAKLRMLPHYDPPTSPDHPGTHFQADVFKKDSQLILVSTDLFSNYTTATLIPSEQRIDILQGLIQLTTPVRSSDKIDIRTDRAPALRSLAQNPPPELIKAGINIALPLHHFNKNSNAKIDKIIQELQLEIKKQCAESRIISSADLARAVMSLNGRIRKSGLSAAEVTFARDLHTHSNLRLRDSDLSNQNINDRPRPPHKPTPPLHPGDIARLKSPGPKHSPSDSFLVLHSTPQLTSAHKLLHPLPATSGPLKVAPTKLSIKTSSLHKLPPFSFSTPPDAPTSSPPATLPLTNPHPLPPPHLPPSYTSDSDSSDLEDIPLAHPPPPFQHPRPRPPSPPPPPPAVPAVIQASLLHQFEHAASLPQHRNVLPHLQELSAAARRRAQQSLPRHPTPPPPPQPPPPPIPQPPPSPSRRPSIPRPAKDAALSSIHSMFQPTQPSPPNIPQLEGAEITPFTTPPSSPDSPTSILEPNPLSPQEPWSPNTSFSQDSDQSLDWDPLQDIPSYVHDDFLSADLSLLPLALENMFHQPSFNHDAPHNTAFSARPLHLTLRDQPLIPHQVFDVGEALEAFYSNSSRRPTLRTRFRAFRLRWLRRLRRH